MGFLELRYYCGISGRLAYSPRPVNQEVSYMQLLNEFVPNHRNQIPK